MSLPRGSWAVPAAAFLVMIITAAPPAVGAPDRASARTVMFCVNDDTSVSFLARPRRCGIYVGPRGTFEPISANLFPVYALRWTGWGRSRATGRGLFQRMGVRVRVTLRVTGRVRCDFGPAAYSRVRVTSRPAPSRTHQLLVPEHC